MYCINCGKEIEKDASFCGNCGAKTQNNNKLDEKNSGIATGVFYLDVIAMIITICYIYMFVKEFYNTKHGLVEYSSRGAFYPFEVILIPTILSIIGLSVSISKYNKNKSDIFLGGIILNSVVLVLQITNFIYSMITYT